ncbi:hypothetical protein CDL15_Pgr020762 [Punica granatum]|uniref:Uncharacterized protein n=3 Tax=Punica granatum TaxID=22663 RepID=A0A218XVI8_PUNGR|nr:hypothetical protein CDL15_Pgr020762 [Punica granatum]
MATVAHANAVKSLNKSSGRRRFVFKTFSQRLEEIEIDVYKSLDNVKSEPSEGSSFFKDCLIEWRELNTAEDFISYYEEIMPLVQTLPLVLLNKEILFSKLVSRLQMKARLSLEPILRLIAALSRDLLEDFVPFLPRVVDSLVSLLKSGADREAEIIEQIFSSWSYIMMYLQKYLIRDIRHVLKVTIKLRYYPKDYVQEFIAEAMSFLLRNAPVEQLIKGIRKIMLEVMKKPSSSRKTGASALLCHAMRGTSLKFHSRAERVLRLLMDKSIFSIGDNINQGADAIIEVTSSAFERLCEELEPGELKLMRNCLYDEIDDSIADQSLSHASRLLTLLISTLQFNSAHEALDYGPLLELVPKIVGSFASLSSEDGSSSVLDNVLNLMLKILSGLNNSGNLPALTSCPQKWAPVFQLQNLSLLNFIRELLSEDVYILQLFKVDIIRLLDNLIESNTEEVIYLLTCFCEKMEAKMLHFNLLEGITGGGVSRIRFLIGKLMSYWSGLPCDKSSNIEVDETKLALLWGAIRCFPHIFDNQESLHSLMALIDAFDQLLMAEDDNFRGFSRNTWQSLIGGALNSYNKLHCGSLGLEDANKFIQLAKRHYSCRHVLLASSDCLDSISGSITQTGMPRELDENVLYGPSKFTENLCHSDKGIRISTLKILCHFKMLSGEISATNQSAGIDITNGTSETCQVLNQGADVLPLLLSIEQTPLMIATSRKVICLISKIQMDISAGRISETYITVLLYAMIGIFQNRFSYIWDPASECLSVLISKHTGTLWEKFICYFEDCQSTFLCSHNREEEANDESSVKSSDLVKHFNSFVNPALGSTPQDSLLSLLIQSLQKIPTICEARSRQLIPLFLKFLGYNSDELSSVDSYNSRTCKGKRWKGVLKEWLNLIKSVRNPKSFYRSQFLKDVLQIRLLDENDAEIQMKVLDCLLLWKDDFLLPYEQNLKNLICSKNLREELTTWSLSCESSLIEAGHRAYIVPLAVRILAPKVRKLKTLASRKHASVHHRRAVLSFLAELDTTELPLFFKLLIKPLRVISLEPNEGSNWCQSPGSISLDDSVTMEFLKYFTTDNIVALSWKKISGFLHVVEDVLGTFDEFHLGPFLNLLMGIVVRILGCCTFCLDGAKGIYSSSEDMSASVKQTMDDAGEAGTHTLMRASAKQLKDVRSFCLKIVYAVLNKYEDHDFDCEFWDLFFTSVKPLINNFKQEGSSSEKPSSLFSSFLAMSRSHRLVSLLYRAQNLVPDIFSILTVSTVSEAVVSGVLKFIENLLNLENDFGEEDNSVRSLLLLNLETLICSLHSLFMGNNVLKRKLIKRSGETQIKIFKSLSKFVKDPLLARKFLDILLLFLSKETHNSDLCVDVLQVVRDIVPVVQSDTSTEILHAISPLLTHVETEKRSSICDLLVALAENNPSMLKAGKLVRELNSISAMEADLDYDTIIGAYETITTDFFSSVREEHALLVLSQCVHDLSSTELILRDSAYRSLLALIDFCAQIVDREEKDNQEEPEAMVVVENCFWDKSSVHRVVEKFLMKHIGEAMKKGAPSRKEWIDLLRNMVVKLPEVANLSSLKPLCSEDAEVDFFNNLIHLQKHRRARALSRFRNVMGTSNISEAILESIFVPMFFNMLFDVQHGKLEHIRNACLEALASIAAKVEWKSYYALLIRCFREISLDAQKQKVVLRLICSILDQFHFMKTFSDQGPELDHASDDLNSGSASYTLRKCSSITFTDIQASLLKSVLPKLQKLLNLDSDKVNVSINLAALKLLKLLPGEIMEAQLPSIIHRVSNFLKSRLESIRDEARSALAACLKELGVDYLHFILKVLQATLKRGFEVHVLGYTLNFMLSKVLNDTRKGKLDYCLEDLLSVVENDILGDVSEEKEVEKIASKMKETKKRVSYETLKMIAQNITFKSHASKLLSPVTAHMQKHLTPKKKVKLENMLSHIAAGIECNPSVEQTDLFVFIYSLIEDDLNKEKGQTHEKNIEGKEIPPARVIGGDSPSSHMITFFALRLLLTRLKNLKLDRNDALLLSMLDPFIVLLCKCLGSKYEDILSASLRCLIPLIRLPLPSLEPQADKIKAALLSIANSTANSGNPLMESCLRLLTVLLQSMHISLSSEQLHVLIRFPMFVELERNSSPVALSLLKAIIHRKLVVHEIYDVVTQVAELMVTSQVESIRKKCSQILLQFLLDYPLSQKRLQQHLDFLLSNLRYEHSSGREAVLEMLHAVVVKFPKNVLDEQAKTIFIDLVLCLANDHDNKVRSMTGAVIKLLVGRISQPGLNSILDYSLSWYLGEKKQLWGAAAQVLGLLVEVMKKAFQTHISSILPATRSILHSAVNAIANHELEVSEKATPPLWKEAYYSLVMLEKILQQFPHLSLVPELEDTWELISELLLHPHMWVRNITSRLVAFYFATMTEACTGDNKSLLQNYFLMRPSRLFFITVSLCCQLKNQLSDDSAASVITENLIFALCSLHSSMGCMEPEASQKFWSSIGHDDQVRFLRAFQLVDPGKGRATFLYLNSEMGNHSSEGPYGDVRFLLVRILFKTMGKIALQMEPVQMKIVFNTFLKFTSQISGQESLPYSDQLLIPVFKVCEGHSGKVIPEPSKQFAQEISESLRNAFGIENFVRAYAQIRKDFKDKRDKRKRDKKLLAVVDPERNAKRKLRIAAKNRANKRRKIMSLKMQRWMR